MHQQNVITGSWATQGDQLIADCSRESVRLLERNVVGHGILAASVTPQAEARAYTRIFGRDAAICVLGMLGSGSQALHDGAIASLDALARLQAPNGQIPKYVDPHSDDSDFWYLGCIDATLWWLLAVHEAKQCTGLVDRWRQAEERALNWLLCQEHQRFYLLQQNEASDWADIMPRSGFVLYTNALWYRIKQIYDLPHIDVTRGQFNHLFHPFGRERPDDRRTRLLQHYVRQRTQPGDLYLSFVNLALFGAEGDVFGNLLAILNGLAGDSRSERIIASLERHRVADPYPVRVVCEPIPQDHELWRAYMGRHQQNHEFQYHNGGIWPFIGGFWVMALAKMGKREQARQELKKLALINSLDNWRFTEWFHGQTMQPLGMAGQSWNAATFLMAQRAVEGEARPESAVPLTTSA
jgi:hypothetical protein